jgi:hypothetical protein
VLASLLSTGIPAIAGVHVGMALLLLLASVMSPDIPAGVYFLAFNFIPEIAGQGHAGVLPVCRISPFLWAMFFRSFQNVNFPCFQDISLE